MIPLPALIARNIVNGNLSTARTEIFSSANSAETALDTVKVLVTLYDYTYPQAVFRLSELVSQ